MAAFPSTPVNNYSGEWLTQFDEAAAALRANLADTSATDEDAATLFAEFQRVYNGLITLRTQSVVVAAAIEARA